MKKLFLIILTFAIGIGNVYSQSINSKNDINEGNKRYDLGDYAGAIEHYKNALKVTKKSAQANYKMASAYYSLKDYKNAVKYSDNVILIKEKYVEQAYILKGSALDLLGKPKAGIKAYKSGIKEYPNNHLLYFNIAYTFYNLKKYKDVEAAVEKGIKLKPSHASSHFLLGITMKAQGNRVKALLALYNFLLLEPEGKRAKSAYEMLDGQLKKGVKRENDSSTVITVSENFTAGELMLSLLEASKSLEINKDKTEYELFSDNTKSFFSVLTELKEDKNEFWRNFYSDFFYAMVKEDYVETFSYYIAQSRGDETINLWLKNNKEKVELFLKWTSNYERKF